MGPRTTAQAAATRLHKENKCVYNVADHLLG